jgi:hypothetical protein
MQNTVRDSALKDEVRKKDGQRKKKALFVERIRMNL